ncbi:gibberellin 20-oxidase-like protein isoform X2 [Asparagus officinalis]|uniref:gibberellin 20-oxidase-like protein isoform X2 n=1 Tax=Asparagus officinalis TaxID=4686 RepID=UPI00098E3C27|nr:gibberellin 20-oxidase-like protein isoform X2 [Asparagus officinalis]
MSDPSTTSLQLPLLDVSHPLLPSTLCSLSQACRDWGFFHITNHGVSKDLHAKLHSLSKQAFSIPSDIKLKLGPFSPINTYTPHFIASPFFESLRVSGPDYYASAKSSAGVLFGVPNSDDVLQEYGSKMMGLSKKITTILLNCLGDGFGVKYYEPEFSHSHGYLRINNYSPPEAASSQEVEGLGMHTDMSCITILFQDEIGGLQVRSKLGEWMDIMPSEGTLVVNIGDLLQAWSNGRLRSSEHRVILKQPVRRFSLAFFWCFEDERVVAAPEEVVGEGNKRIYKPFVCGDYIKFRENSERGRFEKVGYTVDDFAVTTSSQSKEVDPRRTISL